MTFQEIYAALDPGVAWFKQQIKTGTVFDPVSAANLRIDMDSPQQVTKGNQTYDISPFQVIALPPNTSAGKPGANDAVYIKMNEGRINVVVYNRALDEHHEEHANDPAWPFRGHAIPGGTVLLNYGSFAPSERDTPQIRLRRQIVVWHEAGHALLDRMSRPNLEPASVHMELYVLATCVTSGYYQQVDPSFAQPERFVNELLAYLRGRVEAARLASSSDAPGRVLITDAIRAVNAAVTTTFGPNTEVDDDFAAIVTELNH